MFNLIREKIVYKLFLILFVCIFIPIAIYSSSSYYLSYKSLYNNYIINKGELNRQIADNITDNIYTLKSQSLALYNYDSISYIINAKTKDLTKGYLENYNSVYSNLVSLIQGNSKLDSISMMDLSGEVKFYYDRNMVSQNLKKVSGEGWFQETLEAKGKAVVLFPHVDTYNNLNEKVVSVSRIIVDPIDNKEIGILKIDQRMGTFEKVFSNIDAEEEFLVFNPEGELFYTSKNIDEGKIDEYKELSMKKSLPSNHNGGKIMIAGESDSKWRIVSIIDRQTISKQAVFIKNINFGILIFMFFVCIFLSLLVSFTINKPIQKLIASIKSFQYGNMYEQVKLKRRDEFGKIGNAINNMIVSIRKHVIEEYQMKILKQQAEFENYQSQINPHFLFNTLNSIKAVVIQGDGKKGGDMIQYLSDHFRYSLIGGGYLVPFYKELDYIGKYIALQLMRFGDRCEIEKVIEEEVLSNEIPRMVLQPLVENAFKYGVEKSMNQCRISIIAQNISDDFYIYISNTGANISKEELKGINENLSLEKGSYMAKSENKIGIYNVNARIRYHYGEGYGLRFMSSEENLAVVRIRLPRIDHRE